MAAVRELLVRWGFEVDERGLGKIEKGIDNVKSSLMVVGAAGVAAAASIFGIAKSTADAGEAAFKASEQLGINAQKYQELAYAANLADIEQGDFDNSLKLLSKGAYDAAQGTGAAADAYKKLGVSVKDSSGQVKGGDQLLGELADKFKKMPPGIEKTALSTEFFGRSGTKMISMLNQGSDGLSKMGAEARAAGLVLSDETLAASNEFNDGLKQLWGMVIGLRNTIGAKLLPILNTLIEGVKSFMTANRELIATRLEFFFSVLQRFVKETWNIFVRMFEIVTQVVDLFGGLERVIKIVVIAFSAFFAARALMGLGQIAQGLFVVIKAFNLMKIQAMLAWLAAAAGPILIGAAIVALGLIIEDIIGFFQGKDSVTGAIIEAFEQKFPQAFAVAKAIVGGFVTFLKVSWEGIKSTAMSWWQSMLGIWQAIQGVAQLLIGLWNIVVGALTLDPAQAMDGFLQLWEGIKGILGGIWNYISNFIDVIFGIITKPFGGIQAIIANLGSFILSMFDSVMSKAGGLIGMVSKVGGFVAGLFGKSPELKAAAQMAAPAATTAPAAAPASSKMMEGITGVTPTAAAGAVQRAPVVNRQVKQDIKAPIKIEVHGEPTEKQKKEIHDGAKAAFNDVFADILKKQNEENEASPVAAGG